MKRLSPSSWSLESGIQLPPTLFHPVMILEAPWRVYDFSRLEDQQACLTAGAKNGVGRYLDKRTGLYPQALFRQGGIQRDIHMGIDLFALAGTEVTAFAAGQIAWTGYQEAPGDYGYVLVTEHWLPVPAALGGSSTAGLKLFALFGHLSEQGHAQWRRGDRFEAGARLGYLGREHENGGWVPHLHFQLSLVDPGGPDMPGVVSEEQVALAALLYPDPRWVLGPVY